MLGGDSKAVLVGWGERLHYCTHSRRRMANSTTKVRLILCTMRTIRDEANNRRGGAVTIRIASLLIKSDIIIIISSSPSSPSPSSSPRSWVGAFSFHRDIRHNHHHSRPQQTTARSDHRCCLLLSYYRYYCCEFCVFTSIRGDGRVNICFSSVEQSTMQQTVRVVVYTAYACCSRHLQ